MTFFLVKEKVPGKNKLVPRLMGITRESVMRMDEKTKEVLKTFPLTTVRRWAASPNSFTLDFGDYAGSYVAVPPMPVGLHACSACVVYLRSACVPALSVQRLLVASQLRVCCWRWLGAALGVHALFASCNPLCICGYGCRCACACTCMCVFVCVRVHVHV